MPRSTVERFMKFVEKKDYGCWEWTGHRPYCKPCWATRRREKSHG